MSITFTFTDSKETPSGVIIASAHEDEALEQTAAALDKKLGNALSNAIENNGAFKGKNGQVLQVPVSDQNDLTRVILIGLGKKEDLNALKAEEAGGKLFVAIEKAGFEEASFLADEDLSAHILNGLKLRGYKFERYKSKDDSEDKDTTLKSISVISKQATQLQKTFEALDNVTAGTFLARDLVNTAPNDLYPESYAKIIKDELKPLGVEIDIIDEKKMEKNGMGAILAVGKGSERQPRMVIMRWNGAPSKKDEKPIAFVGKGVTFDTGGISLKPGPNMDEMKMDMGGSATVVGLMKTLALRGAKANVIGVVGLAENMPSSKAYRPGDILTSYSGKTIEVLNTDAEGRLVLSDCLTYVQKTYGPEFIIDLATLTGAMMIALGHEYCGTFANDDTLWKQMEKSSEETGEKLWRMPLDEVWHKEVQSPIADVQNLGKSRYAGSCTAAAFLGHFIEEDTKWAHMDIAGTAWRKSDQPTVPKFGSGFGVRVLNTLVANYYEG